MFHRPDQPEQHVAMIQAGDENLREQLIAGSIPEIRHLARKLTRAWPADQDDAFSIALQAFNQAIDQYRAGTRAPFFSYAYLIIRHRLYDWMRQQQSRPATISLYDQADGEGLAPADRLTDQKSVDAAANLETREALLALELDLEQFGYSLAELTDRFPKHQDSQLLCIRMSRLLAADESLYGQLIAKKRLPGGELAKRSGTPRKTVEKNRANIIFLALLLRSDLQVIQSYISYFEKEASQ